MKINIKNIESQVKSYLLSNSHEKLNIKSVERDISEIMYSNGYNDDFKDFHPVVTGINLIIEYGENLIIKILNSNSRTKSTNKYLVFEV